jgi:hypothetical protein
MGAEPRPFAHRFPFPAERAAERHRD